MTDERGRDLLDVGTRLFGAKTNFDQLNQEIATWFYPARADFTQTITMGEEFADHLTDATPVRMLRQLGDAMGGMMRPANQNWFEVTAPNDKVLNSVDARRKLESMSRVTRRAIGARDSGYRRAAHEADKDFAAFGCSVKSITINKERNGLNFRTWHLRDCAWAENDMGMVDQLHRKMKVSSRGMEKMFGRDKMPEAALADLNNNNPNAEHEIRHVAVPVDMYDPGKKFPKDAVYASVYLADDGTILREEAEYEFPYVVARWATIANWNYGYSPATMVGLPDARLIERASLSIIEATEKSTEPPLVATTESIQGPIDITAGAVTWIDAEYDERLGAAIRPLDLGKNAGIGYNLLDRRTQDMASTFFLDKLNLPQGREKTAYETEQLVQEYIRNALPLFEPMEDEVTGAELDIVVSKLLRLGAYGPPEEFPDILQGQEIKFEFNNPLREARDRQTLNKFNESMGIIGAAAQVDPNLLQEVDTRTMFRDALKVAGDAKWLLSEDEAQANREQVEAQQAAMQEMQQVQQGAQVAQDVAGAAQAAEQAGIA